MATQSPVPAPTTSFTPEQRKAVLTTAAQNLRTVIDSLESLDNQNDDKVLESLDGAHSSIEAEIVKLG